MGVCVNSLEKENVSWKSNNIEWSSKNMWKMISAYVKANVKQQEIKELVALSFQFL